MPPWLTWFVGIGVVTLESTLLEALGFGTFGFQTAIGFTAVLAMERNFVMGAGILAALIVPIEWIAGAPQGFYGLGLVGVFFAVSVVSSRLPAEWSMMHLLTGVVAGFVHPVVVWSAMGLLAPRSAVGLGIVGASVPSAVGLALFLWGFGPAFRRLDGFFDRSGRPGGLNGGSVSKL